jgi:hypothetical protein
MFETENISPTITRRATFARLCSLLLVAAFLFAQTLSSAHSHDHADEKPLHQSCEVCILAVNDDGDFDILADLEPDAEDTSFFWAQIDRLALPEAKRAPPVGYAERTIDPPPDPHQRLDSARAPPFYI